MQKRIIESFNAKFLDLEQLSKTFVPSENFKQVAQNSPVLLVGARGSGKTTLLKMLSNKVLPGWNHCDAESYRAEINYEGIYVPADSVWGDMLHNLSAEEEIKELLSRIAFSTNVYLSMLESMDVSLHEHIKNLTQNELSEIKDDFSHSLRTISSILKVDADKHSIFRIKSELTLRLNYIGEYARFHAAKKSLSVERIYNDLEYAALDLDKSIESILSIFDESLSRQEKKWAILLDEFEIAPESLQHEIIGRLRSGSKKHIYKIALVPCGKHLKKDYSASSKNDYDVVQLWNKGISDTRIFCSNIVKSRFNIHNPESVFKSTEFVDNKQISNSKWLSVYKELKDKDSTFKEYLSNKKIDIEKVFSDKKTKSSDIRKIGPQVAFRNSFKNSSGKKKRRDILPEFYAGWDAIVRISEGNPRWIMSTISSLIGDIDKVKGISLEKQAKCIVATTKAYKSMISTTAIENNMGISTSIPPMEIISKLAARTHYNLIDLPFTSDPQGGSFIVDKSATEDVKQSLMIAINHGAIISIEDDADIWGFKDIEGRRFRLSFLFSPVYKLLLRNAKDMNLTSVLNSELFIDGQTISDQGEWDF